MPPAKTSSDKIDLTLDSMKVTLQIIVELAELSPAKCVAPIIGSFLKIIQIFENARSNQEECLELRGRLGDLMIAVFTLLKGKTDDELDASLKPSLDRFSLTLLITYAKLQSVEKDLRSTVRAMVTSQRTSEKLKACKEGLNWAMETFQVEASIQSNFDNTKRHLQASEERAEILEAVHQVATQVQSLTLKAADPQEFIDHYLPSLQLPAAPEVFHGRDEATEQSVSLLLDNDPARVFICGSGGIGKTSLALTVVHHPDVAKRFREHRYWVPCEQAPTPAAFVQIVARSLDVTIASGSKDPFKDLIATMQGGEVVARLLILDNFETTWDTPHQAEVRPLLLNLVNLKGISIIITTRNADPTTYGLVWSKPPLRPLGQLSLEAARAAYIHHLPDASPDEDLDRLLSALDCYPLAITLMAGQGALGETPSSLLKRWEEEKSMLLSEGFDKHSNLDISIEFSIKSRPMRENPGALQVLSILALLPAGTTVEMLPQIPNVRRHISTLLRVSLAYRHAESGVIGTLSPIAAYVLLNHPPSIETLEHLRAEYDKLFRRFNSSNFGSEAGKAAAKILAREEPNVESVLRHSIVSGDQKKTFTTVIDYTDYLSWTHASNDLLLYAMDRVDPELITHAENARAYHNLATNSAFLGEYADALKTFQRAESLFVGLGNRAGAGHCQVGVGEIYRVQGRYPEARKMLGAAEASYKIAEDPWGTAQCQMSLGEIFVAEFNFPKAKELLRSAQSLFEADGLRLGAAQCQMAIGHVLQGEEEYVEGERLVRQALATFRELGAGPHTAQCLQFLGDLVRASGRVKEGCEYLQEAIAMYKQLGKAKEVDHCEEQLFVWKVLYGL